MKPNTLGAVIGSVVGGISFYPLTMPVSLTIMLSREIDPLSNDWGIIRVVSWLIILTGVIIGGLFGGYIGKNKPSFIPFKKISLSIIFWFIVTFGIFGLEIGFWFSGVTLIGLGNSSTAIDLWIFSGIIAIVGVVSGALIGILVALIRLAINKFYVSNNPERQQNS